MDDSFFYTFTEDDGYTFWRCVEEDEDDEQKLTAVKVKAAIHKMYDLQFQKVGVFRYNGDIAFLRQEFTRNEIHGKAMVAGGLILSIPNGVLNETAAN